MTEIRPSTPDEHLYSDSVNIGYGLLPRPNSSTIAMQGFAGSSSSSVAFAEEGDGHMSLHSEPDMDMIMPLPGAALRSAHAQMKNVASPLGSSPGEEGSNNSEDELEGSTRKLLSRQSSDFATVEHPMIGQHIFGDDLTAKALETCKRTVLQPYFIFLKMIGWRRLRTARYDLEPPLWQSVVNVVWPTFVCLLIIVSCATQIITCFRRDTVHVSQKFNSSNETYYDVECERHFLTTFIIPDILLISAFVYGLYIFRWVQTEQLSTLTEAVFLGHITRHGRYSHKRLTITLQFLISLGPVWILFSLGSSIFRVFSLHLLSNETRIEWIPSYQQGVESSNLVVRWVLVVITIIGFIVLDIAYTAVVINYSIQCQLLVYLFRNICDRMLTKEWEIDQAIKETKNAREFLGQLNSHLARAVTIMLFIFLTSSVNAFYGLQQLKPENDIMFAAIGGILSAIQWTISLALPLIQAARVTRACTKLKKTVLEIRSRPYNYMDTPQLDLDSLVTFTAALNINAKLISIPIYPALVAGLFFFTGLVLFLVFQFDNYSWAKWL